MLQAPPQKNLHAVQLWKESRSLPANRVADVEAYVVPASGVGWIDFRLRRHGMNGWQAQEKKRLVSDWGGQTQSDATRQVVGLADGWFTYCEELARRESVVLALAQNETTTGATREA